MMRKRKLDQRLADEHDEDTIRLATPPSSRSQSSEQKSIEPNAHDCVAEEEQDMFEDEGEEEEESNGDELSNGTVFDGHCVAGRGTNRQMLSHVGQSMPGYPGSAYAGWTPALPPVSEYVAIHDLWDSVIQEKTTARKQESDHNAFALEAYSIYRPKAKVTDTYHGRSGELVALDQLTRDGCQQVLFDGVLVNGLTKRYVQGVTFKVLSIDGYGADDIHDTTDRLWIQTTIGRRSNTWYRLGAPSMVYARFDKPFRWLVQFTKFFIDFLLSHDMVGLDHFRHHFHKWISAKYSDGPTLHAWLDQSASPDFRTAVNANIEFLHKEWHGIHPNQSEAEIYDQPIWGEVLPRRLKAIPRQDQREQKTIVTPFAADCFKDMYFAPQMEVRVLDQAVRDLVNGLKRKLKLTPLDMLISRGVVLPTPDSLCTEDTLSVDIKAGDVVCYPAEEHSEWRAKSSTLWFAFVQAVRNRTKANSDPTGSHEQTVLDVLWLYQSADTTMGNVYYPFPNELFMSDNCACGKNALPLKSIIGKVDVCWYEQRPPNSGYFVRQKFGTVCENDEHYFESLKPCDFQCSCASPQSMFDDCEHKYCQGDTVLIRAWDPVTQDDWLEPAQILDFDYARRAVKVRHLDRARRHDVKAAPNQLLLTERLSDVAPSNIIRRCHVLILGEAESVPVPYDRGGAGDLYFLRPRDPQVPVIQHSPSSIPLPSQGWRPSVQEASSRGLGIFCGGGNLDRGLEEGGAVHFTHAVDFAPLALHTYRANAAQDPPDTQLFLGSVNDYLALAMAGIKRALRGEVGIASPGECEVLAGGSPCPGFSMLQKDKLSEQSQRNASMVASVISYVDFYCPKYLFLENVVEMTAPAGPNKDENVFGQVIACLVALGYQVQQFLMDAWTVGSPQHRSRIFVVASAPGMTLLETPPYTHSHLPNQRMGRNLGKGANGVAFGNRRWDDVPFKHISFAEATDDLPNIGDSMPQICPSFPDHRTPRTPAAHWLTRIAVIPVIPEGCGFINAAAKKPLSGEPLRWFNRMHPTRTHKSSKTMTRAIPSGLFSCVVTILAPTDSRGGRTIHPRQHRTLSVMELRRALGMLDHEVIIGNPPDQVKILGNSVDRMVALTLGLALRQSLETQREEATTQSHGSVDEGDDLLTSNMDSASASDEDPFPLRGSLPSTLCSELLPGQLAARARGTAQS